MNLGPIWKNLSKDDLIRYFSRHFRIISIEDSVHTEHGSGEKRYFHSVFMERK